MAIPKDLDDGIFGAVTCMSMRDIVKAHTAVQTYLGKDTVAEAASEKFSRLSPDQQEYFRNTDLGGYGVRQLMTTFEVEAALHIVAREIDPAHCFHNDLVKSLSNAAQAAKVTERFPAITAERIVAVLPKAEQQIPAAYDARMCLDH